MHEHDRTNSPVSQAAIAPAPLIQHRDAAPNVPEYQLREAIADILAVIARYPELTDFGFGIGSYGRDLQPAEREEKFQINRAKMFEERSLRQFIAARDWLQRHRRSNAINHRGTSYGLKHVAAHDIGYVTNGIFIAAAVSAGFRIERAGEFHKSPNAFMNISSSAWRRPRPRVARMRRWR